jgi:hypothetical protein
MPEPVLEQPQQPVAPPPAPEPSPQSSARAAIYEQYYGGQQPAAPEPPAEPAVAQPVEPAAPPAPVVDETVAALRAEIEQLKAAMRPAAPPAAEPVAAPATKKDWLALLSEGDKNGFEQALADTVRQSVEPEVLQRSVSEAVQLIRAENEVSKFVDDLRRENPELRPYEEYIGFGVQAQIAKAQASGKITSIDSYLSVYKEAVKAEAEKARNLIQQARAAGKTEAQTLQKQVISASTLPPQAIDSNRGAPENPEAPAIQTPEEYFRDRLNRINAGKGLAA